MSSKSERWCRYSVVLLLFPVLQPYGSRFLGQFFKSLLKNTPTQERGSDFVVPTWEWPQELENDDIWRFREGDLKR